MTIEQEKAAYAELVAKVKASFAGKKHTGDDVIEAVAKQWVAMKAKAGVVRAAVSGHGTGAHRGDAVRE